MGRILILDDICTGDPITFIASFDHQVVTYTFEKKKYSISISLI